MSRFVIVKDVSKYVRRFRLTGRQLEFKIKPVPDKADPVEWVKGGVNEAVLHATSQLNPDDMVGITLCSKDFKRGDGWLSIRKASQLTTEDVWNLLHSIFQSNGEALNTDTFCLGITAVKLPVGSGRGANRGRSYINFDEECIKRRGIITINNKDNLCLPRALVVATAHSIRSPFFRQIRTNQGRIQDDEAEELILKTGIKIPSEGCGIEELKKFQSYFKDFKITVYTYGSKGRDVLYEGPDAPNKINLLYHDNHFNVITSLTSAFCCSYFCEECRIPYNNKNAHRCFKSCPCCQQSTPCERTAEEVDCEQCRRKFRGIDCYNKHKAPNSYGKKTVCEIVKRCRDCLRTVKADRVHTCDELFCKICGKHQPYGHNCYIQPNTNSPKTNDILFVFYDLETRQTDADDVEVKTHVPNLCVFKQVCSDCDVSKPICKRCGVRLQVIRYEDPICPFVHHVLMMRKKFKKVIVIAHYGQAFDHQFVLKYIIEFTDIKPELIMRGTKIIVLGVDNVKFLDSFNYFPMKLSELPEAFGLGTDLKKGFFPHMFNTLENADYEGSLPDIKYYEPDSMRADDRAKFLEWYEEHKNDRFNLQQQLIDYCIDDVDILTKACLKFRKMFLEQCDVCPFTEATTIASACNLAYRRNYLKRNTIGIIPRNGYRNIDNQSKIAIQWLIWEESQRNIDIIHSAKQKEVRVAGVAVDGFCKKTKQIFEFHGCYYHGHSCILHRRDEPLHEDPSDTLNNRLQRTIKKTERLRKAGYEVVEKWECEFRQELSVNPAVAALTENHPLLAYLPLNPRDAFYGGRTGNTKSYYKIKPGEKIKYVDVCSLYPWVCKYGKFPVGHPKVSVGGDKQLDLNSTDGLVKCKILPPQQLYHPVLPVKMNSKLMFVLCRTCGERLNQNECTHTEDERALTGVWVIDEVRAAVERGYRILEVYEVWKYNIEQYDQAQKTGGLFTSMMNQFIKIKQQASGWPGNCVTEEEKEAYIEQFFEREGVKLEFAEIAKNPGLRAFAKLILNSFWGKFGQRQNQTKTAIVDRPDELFAMLTNPSLIIDHMYPVNDTTLVVNWEYKDEAMDLLPTVNVCIAAYTTAQARLKLYSYLERLGDRVLYYDTDSILYISRNGDFDVPTGTSLGDMTDELEKYGAGSYIEEFVSGGPKNYAFKVFSTKSRDHVIVCKIKGISLNYSASKLINFDSIKKMILEDSEPIHITSRNIRRTEDHSIISKDETKTYRPRLEKRKFTEDHESIPYGYKRIKT